MKLKAENISFRYSPKLPFILENFNIELCSHERVGIFAPSGYGKTTLCKILSGYDQPEIGSVTLDGAPLQDFGPYCPVQMIWQHPEYALNPKLRMSHVFKEAAQIDPAVIEQLGIEKDWLQRFPGELSGGELQRFCIARVLGNKTKFIIADEITTMLDPITQSQIWNFLLSETKRRNIGLLIVSHVSPLLDILCTRQIKLDID
ncbi:MAG: ATP-binding cassette domain-containing protein [Oscillospiraceae bacterium]|nr:ATP-binding cassette domain-containing protein [Oscillospiraceae bacterium]